MLAAALSTVAWICFAVGVIGQLIWALTDGRRPAMPHELYDSMIIAVGTTILAPVVVLLDIYSPDRFAPLGVAMLLILTFASFRGKNLTRPDQPIHPVTPAWEAAARRSAQFGRLFVAGTGGLILIARPENLAICALGVIAAMNLRPFSLSLRENRLGAFGRIWMAMPFIIAFVAWYASRNGSILQDGLNVTYADLVLQVHAPIPGNDVATVDLLQSYICFMLLFHLLAMVVEVVGRGKALTDTIFLLLKFLRGGIALIALLFLLPDPPTASALFVKYLLFAIEVAALIAPSPDASIGTTAAQRQDAASPA